MEYTYCIPKDKKVRLIINTDAKNEVDDQFTIAHAILSPKFVIKGIIGAHFGERRTSQSMQESYEECKRVVDLLQKEDEIPVLKGAKRAMDSKQVYEYSDGAKLIVEEALKESDIPLYAIFMGPLTDLAAAYQKHPEITGKLTAVWTGGGKYPDGGEEFNLSNDIVAANIVMESGMEFWQIPSNVYGKMQVSIAELEKKVRPCGRLGKYLYEQLEAFRAQEGMWNSGEAWTLGDAPTIAVLLSDHWFAMDEIEAPGIAENMRYIHNTGNRKIKVFNYIDNRFVLEDMYAKFSKLQ